MMLSVLIKRIFCVRVTYYLSVQHNYGQKISIISRDLADRNLLRPLFVIEYFLVHETKHIYQHIQIVKYKEGKNDVGNQYIVKRIKENENYEQSVDKDGNENRICM